MHSMGLRYHTTLADLNPKQNGKLAGKKKQGSSPKSLHKFAAQSQVQGEPAGPAALQRRQKAAASKGRGRHPTKKTSPSSSKPWPPSRAVPGQKQRNNKSTAKGNTHSLQALSTPRGLSGPNCYAACVPRSIRAPQRQNDKLRFKSQNSLLADSPLACCLAGRESPKPELRPPSEDYGPNK